MNLNSQFAHELTKAISLRLTEIAEVMSAGTPKDYAEYRQYVGRFQELQNVRDSLMQEVNEKINKR